MTIQNGENGQIKSRHRVRELAEVFTHEREVNAMLDLAADVVAEIGSRVLEPACGDGNFLEEVLRRKFVTVDATCKTQAEFEFRTLQALTTTYGIDIQQDNVEEAQARLRALVVNHYSFNRGTWQPKEGFYRSVEYVLSTNIVTGDTISGPGKIVLVEFTIPKRSYFAEKHFTLESLIQASPVEGGFALPPSPFKTAGPSHYLVLGVTP
jgi:hypothetical protein